MKHITPFLLAISIFSTPIVLFAHGSEAKDCSEQLKNQSVEFAQRTSETVFAELKHKGMSTREARGYAILISAMVGSAAGATYLTTLLPADYQFLSLFVAQISALGVYRFGAPIWEPLGSGFRKLAFGVQRSDGQLDVAKDPGFRNLWRRTQENYSINEQMSRNVINQFVISVQQNVYEAYRAARGDNTIYAADQIAEAAFRLRTLFKDISPDDPSVASVVRSAFTNHIAKDEAFADLVLTQIQRLDPSYVESEVENYYLRILETWLGP